MPKSSTNGWSEYKELVLAEMKRADDRLEKLETKIDSQHAEVMREISSLKLEISPMKVRESIRTSVLSFVVTSAVLLIAALVSGYFHK